MKSQIVLWSDGKGGHVGYVGAQIRLTDLCDG